MKIQNLIIGVLAIAVVVLSYLLYRAQGQQPKTVANYRNMVECKDTLISTDGEITTWKTVKPFIDSFDVNEQVRAFHIGIENLRLLMSKIDQYDSTVSAGNKVVGLRFYKAVTTRRFISAGNVYRTVVNKPDLIVVPSLAEKNLHEVNAAINVPIYWRLRPCPKLCRKKLK